ncbi:cytochrome c biogenesis protein CcdA [Bacillus mesophilus]|uniref:Sulfite exporter TauE/SafE family protein n=1 Tax=Bacillus mesophilus TaxID=1808955 RepID=A0A6M0QBS8_9BACI|nr:sulfite exporter TauE/SafE family protein [Bacillus mesophilus]MBM7660149.1 cytochrome c biogenesis protein CcdA [Bacillus mesophilus]NEY73802.1 sulfite exporter TauE/SafE family protein [Bacillus mesophilus]
MYEFFSNINHLLSEPFLNVFYQVESFPLIAAFVLGLVGALAPCQFTGNLGAITLYGNRSIQDQIAWKEAFFFTLGKITVFSVLGVLVWVLGSEFQQSLTLYFPWVRKLIGPMLILIGFFMIGWLTIRWNFNILKPPERKKGSLGAFLMGVSFSLGFCPTMFILFFVTLIPMVVSTSYGVVLPGIFAIGTSLPLLLALLVIWYFDLSGKVIKKKGRKVGHYVQRIAGLIMIVLGTVDTITYW